MALIMVLSVVGIVINFGVLIAAADKEPEGLMGAGIFFLIAFIPFSLPVLFLASKIMDLWGSK